MIGKVCLVAVLLSFAFEPMLLNKDAYYHLLLIWVEGVSGLYAIIKVNQKSFTVMNIQHV